MSRASFSLILVLGLTVLVSGCQTAPAPGSPTAPEPSPAEPPPPPPPAFANPDDAARVYASLQLLPQPRRIEFAQGGLSLAGSFIESHHDSALAAEVIDAYTGLELMLTADANASVLRVDTRLAPDAQIPAQGYALNIGPHGITVSTTDDAGAYYAAMTLKQLLRQTAPAGVLPFLQIADHPDFLRRGAMLDISRDKVPRMETLYSLVDQFSEWKFNELQLYTEHTFAYAGHDAIWKNASPMTPEDIRALDEYCRARFIELVPNQNSFGHMTRWLKHPDYKHLAERPNIGYMLCPVDPDAIQFLAGLYDDLLPNFSSGMFNVGCDEAYAIGRGRSAASVNQRGVGRVYLDFLLEIHRLVRAHGKTMQFWGDIILEHPSLIAELPNDVIALNWGYEDNHPFASQTAKFAAAGIPFYVAPGTSSWNAILGRTDNAIANLRNAATHGLANGAIGYLITDWGDGGHWQFLPVSYVGFAYGAGVSWCLDANQDLDVPAALDTHVFYDRAGVMGRIAYDLGNAYQRTGALIGNNTTFNIILKSDPAEALRQKRIASLNAKDLEQTLAYLDALTANLDRTSMMRTDADLLVAEFRTGATLAAFACKLGIARLNAGDRGIGSIPSHTRRALADELRVLIDSYQTLWLARNREGGLSDSIGQFKRILAALEG